MAIDPHGDKCNPALRFRIGLTVQSTQKIGAGAMREPRFTAPPDGRLTADMRAAYAQTGFLVLEGYRSAAACDAVSARAADLIAAFDPATVSTVFAADSNAHTRDDYFLGSGDKIRFFLEPGAFDAMGQLRVAKERALNKIGHALHDLDPVFDGFSRGADLAATAADIGLIDPVLMQSMLIFKQPRIGAEVGLHQDATFLHSDPVSCTGFWFALEDADESNGCLIGLAGAHRQGLKERSHFVDGRIVKTRLDDTPFTGVEMALPAPKGTLVLLHGLAPHRSTANSSDRSRWAYALHAHDRATRWSDDNWLKRDAGMALRGF